MRISTRPGQAALAIAIAAMVLALLPASAARAECSPGQMSEAGLQFQSAQAMLNAQQWDQAIPQLLSITGFCPDYVPALRGLGMAYLNTGKFEQAQQAYQKVIDVRGLDAEAADYSNLGMSLLRQKKYKEARAEYMKAERLEPDDCAVLYNLGLAHLAAQYYPQAVTTLENAYNNCPQLRDRIAKQLAAACEKAAAQQRQIGNKAQADAYAKKATEYAVDAGGSTTYDLIKDAMNKHDFAKAVDLCDQLLAKDPTHGPALLTKARALDAEGQKDASVTAYQAYLKVRDDDINATAAMIIVMSEADQCDQARSAAAAAAQKFAAMGAQELGKINFAWGKALFCAKDYEGARAKFAEAAKSGDAKWVGPAREAVGVCDQYIQYQNQKAQASRQGR